MDKLVVLDLDETLIYATKKKLGIEEDLFVSPYYVYKRPHLDAFLTKLAAHYKIAIWSSADDDYVKQIIDKIKPQHLRFEFVWGRSRTTKKRASVTDEYYFIKRLSKIKKNGFSLENALIIDDTAEKSSLNYGNAIQIAEFTGDSTDNELLLLSTYLQTLKDIENVRIIEKRFWRNEI